jgi:hypothetical protein
MYLRGREVKQLKAASAAQFHLKQVSMSAFEKNKFSLAVLGCCWLVVYVHVHKHVSQLLNFLPILRKQSFLSLLSIRSATACMCAGARWLLEDCQG